MAAAKKCQRVAHVDEFSWITSMNVVCGRRLTSCRRRRSQTNRLQLSPISCRRELFSMMHLFSLSQFSVREMEDIGNSTENASTLEKESFDQQLEKDNWTAEQDTEDITFSSDEITNHNQSETQEQIEDFEYQVDFEEMALPRLAAVEGPGDQQVDSKMPLLHEAVELRNADHVDEIMPVLERADSREYDDVIETCEMPELKPIIDLAYFESSGADQFGSHHGPCLANDQYADRYSGFMAEESLHVAYFWPRFQPVLRLTSLDEKDEAAFDCEVDIDVIDGVTFISASDEKMLSDFVNKSKADVKIKDDMPILSPCFKASMENRCKTRHSMPDLAPIDDSKENCKPPKKRSSDGNNVPRSSGVDLKAFLAKLEGKVKDSRFATVIKR